MNAFPVSPLSLDCLTRDVYGSFDASIIAQLAPLAENECYQPKIYRAPSVANELMAGYGYASYGLKITPGAIIYGFYLPPVSAQTPTPGRFNVQITDESLHHLWFDQPVPSYFLGNCKPTYLSVFQEVMGSACSFLDAPYPVVGNGLLMVEIWETSGQPQRIELIFGALEPIGEACL